VADLEALDVRVVGYKTRDAANACGAFYDALADAKVTVRRHADLDAAVAGVARKAAGDAWVWARRSNVDVSPLIAATFAWRQSSLDQGVDDDVWVSF
jgi:hypothetical protein